MKGPVDLHLDKLVLRGVPPERGAAVRAAIVAELGRLFAEHGVPSRLARGGSFARLAPGPITVDPAAEPAAAGRAVARAVYGALAGSPRRHGGSS